MVLMLAGQNCLFSPPSQQPPHGPVGMYVAPLSRALFALDCDDWFSSMFLPPSGLFTFLGRGRDGSLGKSRTFEVDGDHTILLALLVTKLPSLFLFRAPNYPPPDFDGFSPVSLMERARSLFLLTLPSILLDSVNRFTGDVRRSFSKAR